MHDNEAGYLSPQERECGCEKGRGPPILPGCGPALPMAELLNSHKNQAPGCSSGFLSWRSVGFPTLGFKCQSSLTQPNLDFPVEENRPFGGSDGDSLGVCRGVLGAAICGSWRCASGKPIWGYFPALQATRAGGIQDTSISLLFPKYNLSFIGKPPALNFYLDPM